MELILKNWHAWMWSVSTLAAAILFALAVHTVLFFVLTRLARRKGDVFISSLVNHGRSPSRWILPLLTLMAALPAARLSESVQTPIERAVGLGLIAATAWLVILISQIISDLISARYRLDLTDNLAARRVHTQIEVLHRIVVVIIVIYTLVNLTTARAIVFGPSMQPNFYTGQLVIINRFAYFFNGPARGDVVVVHSPRPECRDAKPGDTNCEDLIKRVIGLPGELVMIKGGRVYINGTRLEEPYISEFCKGCDGKWHNGVNQYLILGDNRNNSWDGHSFGPITRDLIVGEAWIRYWPPQDANVIPHPVYTPAPAR